MSDIKRHLETHDDKQQKLVPRYRPVRTNWADKINKMISKYIAENMLLMLTVESMAFLDITNFYSCSTRPLAVR